MTTLIKRIVRWADARFMTHITNIDAVVDEHGEVKTEEDFRNLPFGAKWVVFITLARATPYALFIGAACHCNPDLWDELS